MKKTHLFATLLALTGSLLAQPYGEKAYPHQSTLLSSGKRTSVNPGFLLGGYRATGSSTDDNFYLDKTDDGGLFTSSATSFQGRYALRQPNTAGFTCATGLMPVTNCVGVSAIEVSNGDIAVVGAYDKGMFFIYMNSLGVPSASRLFMFPGATSRVMKPLIAEDPSSGEFFVCGSYDDGTQVLSYFYRLDASGAVSYSAFHEFGGGLVFWIKDMIASPYNVDCMTIVGAAYDGLASFSEKGFIAEYDVVGATYNFFNGFGQPGTTGNDTLNCIGEAPGVGYVVGGYSDVTGAADNDWFMQLSTTGASQWSNIFSPSSPDNTGGVQAIISLVEPVNSGKYIYGASYSPTKGMVVMKQDGASSSGGAWVGAGLTAFNEFEYTLSSPNLSSPVAMSYNFSGSADVGMHVYGRGNASGASNHYLVEAYLNGEEACNPVRGPGGTTSAFTHSTFTGYSTSSSASLTPCNNFLVIDNFVSPPLLNNICSASSMTTGSNLRPASATGLSEGENAPMIFSLAPNPAAGYVRLQYDNQEGTDSHFRLLSQLGQELKRIDVLGQTGEQQVNLDLNDLPAGIYFLEASLNGKKQTLKLVHSNN